MTQSLSEAEESDQTPTWASVESVVEWVVLGVDQTRMVRVLNREATRIGPGLGAITRWAEPPGKDQCLVREDCTFENSRALAFRINRAREILAAIADFFERCTSSNLSAVFNGVCNSSTRKETISSADAFLEVLATNFSINCLLAVRRASLSGMAFPCSLRNRSGC